MITITYSLILEPENMIDLSRYDTIFTNPSKHIQYLERDNLILFKYTRISGGKVEGVRCDGITNPLDSLKNPISIYKKRS